MALGEVRGHGNRLSRQGVQRTVKMPTLVTGAALVAAGAVWLSACGTATPPGAGDGSGGSGSAGSASPGGTASVPASSGPASARPSAGTSLTLADNEATVRVSTGQVVTVVLGRHGALSWHVPVAIGTAVRRTGASGGYPGKAPARAVFLAEQPGRAVLTSVDDAACLHSHPACMVPQRSWRVTVIVRAAH